VSGEPDRPLLHPRFSIPPEEEPPALVRDRSGLCLVSAHRRTSMNHRSRKSQKKSKGTSKSKKKHGGGDSGEHNSNGGNVDGGASRRPWVDDLQFRPVAAAASALESDSESPASLDSSLSLSVVSWNVLAQAYCSPRSQVRLPPQYQKRVFHGRHRRDSVVRVVGRFASSSPPPSPSSGCACVDVLCLQEVDMDEIRGALEGRGYRCVETPRTAKGAGGGTGGRVDSCSVFVKEETWRIVDRDLVRLDDLATLAPPSSSAGSDDNDDGVPPRATATATNNLQGLQQSFLRRNVALLVRIQHVSTGETAVVANCHLYWVRSLCADRRTVHTAHPAIQLSSCRIPATSTSRFVS
jgi:hypothetical protein